MDTEVGYYGWVIANYHQVTCEENGLTSSNPKHLYSLRNERSGILNALTVIDKLLKSLNFKASIISASDNLIIVRRTQLICEYNSRLPKHYHMDTSIQCTIDVLILSHFTYIEVIHVKGHEGTNKKSNLTWEKTQLTSRPTYYDFNILMQTSNIQTTMCMAPSIGCSNINK